MAKETYQAGYYKENREEILADHRAWYQKNKKKVIQKAKKRLKTLSKAKRRVISQRYYENHRQEILKRARAAYLNDRVRIKARVKAHAKIVRLRDGKEGTVRGKRVGVGVRTI